MRLTAAAPPGLVVDVHPQHPDLAGLHGAHPGNERQQGRLADAVGSYDSQHLAGGQGQVDGVQRDGVAVDMTDPRQSGERACCCGHGGSLISSHSGQGAAWAGLT